MSKQTADIPEGYRMTGLGPLPEGWGSSSLAELVTEMASGDWGEAGPGDRLVESRVLRGTDFPQAATGNLSTAPIRYVRQASQEKRQLRPGDLLIELSGGSVKQPTGRILHVSQQLLDNSERPLLYSNFLKRVRVCSTTVEPEYLSFYWSYLYEAGKTRVYQKRTTGIWNFKLVDFLDHEYIGIPGLCEQRKIVAVLRIVQEAKEGTEAVIAALRELKKSLMKHLFTYGPVPVDEVDKVPLKETEIWPLPEAWECTSLGAVIADGPQNGIYKHQSAYGEGTLILRIDDYPNDGDIVRRAANRARLTSGEVSKYGLKLGDLLVNRVNSLTHIGKTALIGVLDEPMVFESNMMRFRADNRKALPEYVFRFLTMPFARDQMRRKAKRAVAQSSINQGDVKSLAIPLPAISEQRQICRALTQVEASLAAEDSRMNAIDELFRTLLNDLMTAKIRVNDLEVGA
jgi:type I restriction enzyme S subunit